jgi:hypothetical protein
MLYIVYGSIAPVLLLEASGHIPPDSSRAMTALVFFLAYVLWNEHALMKNDETDILVHELLAKLNLVSAAVYAFSVSRPTNLVAYIAGWGLFVVQTLWLLSAGVNSDFQKIDIHAFVPLFCLEIVFVTLSIVFVSAFFGRSEESVKVAFIDDDGSTNGMSVEARSSLRRASSRKGAYVQLQIEDDDATRLEML